MISRHQHVQCARYRYTAAAVVNDCAVLRIRSRLIACANQARTTLVPGTSLVSAMIHATYVLYALCGITKDKLPVSSYHTLYEAAMNTYHGSMVHGVPDNSDRRFYEKMKNVSCDEHMSTDCRQQIADSRFRTALSSNRVCSNMSNAAGSDGCRGAVPRGNSHHRNMHTRLLQHVDCSRCKKQLSGLSARYVQHTRSSMYDVPRWDASPGT